MAAYDDDDDDDDNSHNQFTLEQTTKAQRWSICIVLLFLTSALDRGGW
jgi:hypothetical protein